VGALDAPERPPPCDLWNADGTEESAESIEGSAEKHVGRAFWRDENFRSLTDFGRFAFNGCRARLTGFAHWKISDSGGFCGL